MLSVVLAVASAGCEPGVRPPATEPALVARWLAASTSWGVVATTSPKRGGAAWGNVQSVADNCTGIPYFYLSPLDETARDIALEPRASLTLAEASIAGRCVRTDPEDPTCAKLSLHGRIVEAPDQKAALAILLERHPSMRGWPVDHGFRAFKMEISDVFALSDYGGAHPISVADYLAKVLKPAPESSRTISS